MAVSKKKTTRRKTVKKDWDLKQLGVGGGSVLGILLFFQSQGIDMMTKHQTEQNNVVIQKTIANTQRITQLEQAVKDINDKMDDGFDGVRKEVRSEVSKISDIIREGVKDRYTRTEHQAYKESMELWLRRVEDNVRDVQDSVYEIEQERNRQRSRRRRK